MIAYRQSIKSVMTILKVHSKHVTRLLYRKSKLVVVLTFLASTLLWVRCHSSLSKPQIPQIGINPEQLNKLYVPAVFVDTDSNTQSVYRLKAGTRSNPQISMDSQNLVSSNLKQLYSSLMATLLDMSPEGELEKKYNPDCKLNGPLDADTAEYKTWFRATYDSLNNCLEIPTEKLKSLREKHAVVTERINQIILPEGSLQGKGVVIVGGGKYSVLAASNIQIMRDFNTTLPVEVFIPPGEDDTQFCEEYLPKYNAKCTHIEDILNRDVLNNVEFKGFQYKSLALLSSSFEHILFLDADNFPMKNLDSIFDEPSYKQNGLILWSDFWRRTDSPKYYDIAGIKYNRNKRVRNLFDDITPVEVYTENMGDLEDVPFHDLEGTVPDASTESGQFLINKKSHWKTIALSLYYNLNGPKWYYPIFSQGGPGEGDKETFASAATVFGLPFYQLRRRPGVGGYHDTSFHGVCMLQEDFRVDFNNYLKAEESIKAKYSNPIKKTAFEDKDKTILQNFYHTYFAYDEPDVMFVHFNFPKLDPIELTERHTFISDNGKHIRSISNLKSMGYFDLELNVHRKLKGMICEDDVTFSYVKKSFKKPETTKEKVCSYIESRIRYLSSTHQDAITPK